ncbi:MAG: hypothetical protein K9G38_01160 [Bacteroidales bacterium]|nr:hypothetical protein [Bacteroidales bacterium]
MNNNSVVELFKTKDFTGLQLEEIDRIISAYPWFGLPRFLRLKALHQLGIEPEPGETGKAVLFCNDRSYLYRWIRGETVNEPGFPGLPGSELEFLDSEADLLQLDEREGEDAGDEEADERGIPEKEESDMEEPEIEEPEATPVIDPMEDEEMEITEPGSTPESDLPDEHENRKHKPEPADELPDDEAAAVSVSELPDDAEQESAPVAGMDDTGQEAGLPEERPADREFSGNRSYNLIEEFLNSEPGVIKADKEASLEGDVSAHSVKEDDSFITDTLAKIYVKQGLHAKAIYAYERLSLKYPEKSAYFAAQIEKIKSITNI